MMVFPLFPLFLLPGCFPGVDFCFQGEAAEEPAILQRGRQDGLADQAAEHGEPVVELADVYSMLELSVEFGKTGFDFFFDKSVKIKRIRHVFLLLNEVHFKLMLIYSKIKAVQRRINFQVLEFKSESRAHPSMILVTRIDCSWA